MGVGVRYVPIPPEIHSIIYYSIIYYSNIIGQGRSGYGQGMVRVWVRVVAK